jgi:hypothetical protein
MNSQKFFFVVLLCALIHGSVLLAKSTGAYQYISPVHGSDYNMRETTIIIREGTDIDPACLSKQNLIEVSGSKSGRISGEIILSSDGKTVIFKPDQKFEPSEKVQVKIGTGLVTIYGKRLPELNFSFIITSLVEPLEYDDSEYESELTRSVSGPALQKTASNDTLPEDFPEFIITQNGETAPGYLFGSSNSTAEGVGNYYMILENSGKPLFYSQTQSLGSLLPNGLFASRTEIPGLRKKYTWYLKDASFTVVDSFQLGNGYLADNHDFQILPNGHALMLCYDTQIIDMSKIIEGGNPAAEVIGAVIQELDVDKNVILQWRSWDHIPITDTYRDPTKKKFPYIHVNSAEFDCIDGNVILSCRETSEVIKFSRVTGEVMWRMAGKNNEFTFLNEHEENAPRYFKVQHDARRLPNGNLTIFDNGADKADKSRPYSRAVEYALDEENKTVTLVWEFRHDPDVMALTGGSATRLPNGNTIIVWGGAVAEGGPAATEVTPAGQVVYEITYTQTGIKGGFSRYIWPLENLTRTFTHYEIKEGNTYDESDSVVTGVIVEVNTYQGESYNQLTIERVPFAPLYPGFIGKAPRLVPVRVVLNPKDITGIDAEIAFNTESFGFANPDIMTIYHREFEGQGVFIPLTTSYNPVTKLLKAPMTKFGEFCFGIPDLDEVAYSPILIQPENQDSVRGGSDVSFFWTPRGFANTYDIQIATDSQFTALVVNDSNLTETRYTFQNTAKETRYHWRVRTRNNAGISAWSEAWFNTVAPMLELTVPNGSETWQRGLRYFITWNDNIEEDVVIELYNGETSSGIIDTTGSDGSYRWDIDFNLETGENYYIKVRSLLTDSLFDMSDNAFTIMDTTTHVNSENHIVIKEYALHPNYPNPFNPATKVVFDLPKDDYVSIKIYDMLGREVITLVDGKERAGSHEINFDGTHLSSGIYMYKMKAGSFQKIRKMILMK